MRIKYLGDILSLLRAASLAPLIYFSIQGEWWLALITLTLGWATDLFDGPVSRKWGSLRDRYPGFDADGIADSVLAFGSAAVPVVYAYFHYDVTASGVLTMLYAFTVIFAIAMVTQMNKGASNLKTFLVAFNMIVMHGIVQIGGVFLWFTVMTTGELVGSIGAVGACLAVVTMFQYDKIALWLDGRFE